MGELLKKIWFSGQYRDDFLGLDVSAFLGELEDIEKEV